MLPLLILSNVRLVVYLFGALVFAAMSWLYFDAMAVRPNKSVLARGVGAMLIALSYLVGAVLVEGLQIEWAKWIGILVEWIRVAGYLILALGVWGEPLSKRPSYAEASAGKPSLASMIGAIPTWTMPVLPALVGLGYWRRASVGLERHLTGMGYGMYALALSELIDLRRLFVNSNDIRIYEQVREFGNIWIAQLLMLFVGFWLISRWVFSYLLRRFETQITLFMGMLVMSVFAMATMVFSYVMANRLEIGAQREVDAGVKMVSNNWAREGDELIKRANELKTVELDDKEELSKVLKSNEQILDSESRDVLTGVKIEGIKEGVGYRMSGVGSTRRVEQVGVVKREGGAVVVSRELSGEKLEQSALEVEMALRLYDQDTVVTTSTVPGYPDIASPLGLTRQNKERMGGVAYTSGWVELEDSEGIAVAKLEAAEPMATLWGSVGQALFWTYLAGVIVLIIMELPAVLMAKYLTRQL